MLDPGPTKGSEQTGYRPCIVVSDDAFNAGSPFRWIMPITTRVKNLPFEVALPEECGTVGVVLTDQLKALDLFGPRANRTFKSVGHVPYESDEFQEVLANAVAILA